MNTKREEIRIRNIIPADHKRIALAARERDLSMGEFCYAAALTRLTEIEEQKKVSLVDSVRQARKKGKQ